MTYLYLLSYNKDMILLKTCVTISYENSRLCYIVQSTRNLSNHLFSVVSHSYCTRRPNTRISNVLCVPGIISLFIQINDVFKILHFSKTHDDREEFLHDGGEMAG